MTKFKVGDKVRALINDNSGRCYTKGNIYVVKDVYKHMLYTTYDDRGSTNNGLSSQFFELVEDKEMTELKVGSKWVHKSNDTFIVTITSVNSWDNFTYRRYVSDELYIYGKEKWLQYMKPYESVNVDDDFIVKTATLKAGRFGQLHITNHNDTVKVSVVQMTNSKQIREVIDQLTKVAEFWEGEGK